MDDDLIELAWGAGIDAVMQGRFGEHRKRVRLLLLEGKVLGQYFTTRIDALRSPRAKLSSGNLHDASGRNRSRHR